MASLSDLLCADWHRHARLLTLTTPAGPDVLLAESARIDEALGPVPGHAGFRIELTALAADAAPSLAGLLGQPARLDLQTATSSSVLRPFHGHITQLTRLGGCEGVARYRLLIEPWLAALGHNRDSSLFQDKTVVEIVDEVFAGWRDRGRLVPAWRWDLVDPASYRRRSMCVQYGESDLAFVRRLLVDEGLCCHFEHSAGEGASLGGHTLVISDRDAAFNVGAPVHFTQASATRAEDRLYSWSARRQPGHTRAASPDYRNLAVPAATTPSDVQADATQDAAARHDSGPCASPAVADGPRLIDDRPAHSDGESTSRSVAPGHRFVLAAQPAGPLRVPAAHEFLVTAVYHQAHNNLTGCFPALLAALGPAGPDESAEAPLARPDDSYRNRLVAQRWMPSWRPQAFDAAGCPLYPRPDAVRPLAAIVVGYGASAHADGNPRIRVQFSRQHRSRSVSDTVGAWLRVVRPVAGAVGGGQLTPRQGQEVLVAFLNGDPDLPVVIGAFYDGQGNPDAPGNRQGADTQHPAMASACLTPFATGGRPGICQPLAFDENLERGGIEQDTTEYVGRL